MTSLKIFLLMFHEISYPEDLQATLLKSHFGMGVLLKVCCIFSEHLFLRAASGNSASASSVISKSGPSYLIRFSLEMSLWS